LVGRANQSLSYATFRPFPLSAPISSHEGRLAACGNNPRTIVLRISDGSSAKDYIYSIRLDRPTNSQQFDAKS